MSLDGAAPTERQLQRPSAHEARQRLEHARATRLTQLRALDAAGHAPDDYVAAGQRDAIERALKEIDDAFTRIEDGTYGTCRGCAKPVPAERLEILPYTRHCVACGRRAA
ncbi:TraR/DksA C4-type zinc finger protein [Streptomyces sp. DH24]|uniref:TraR/DksA C4-type zinc finger protein n=1 Tax=Streptomyces sp. DH24 TaxID=3040123 RepID=UPI002442E826|nr:TraR/DksA C4-type zinc finger protein [Streptomyces sp. DH24]MDG9717272.1 TraR/DksA C4-type zinc finger protein [Streptomyces sp. DH24]